MRFVYADNAATTPVSKKVVEAMIPYMTEHYGNPSSLYEVGQVAHRAVEKARQQVADAIGADGKEIFFTSGGSEALQPSAQKRVRSTLSQQSLSIMLFFILLLLLKSRASQLPILMFMKTVLSVLKTLKRLLPMKPAL